MGEEVSLTCQPQATDGTHGLMWSLGFCALTVVAVLLITALPLNSAPASLCPQGILRLPLEVSQSVSGTSGTDSSTISRLTSLSQTVHFPAAPCAVACPWSMGCPSRHLWVTAQTPFLAQCSILGASLPPSVSPGETAIPAGNLPVRALNSLDLVHLPGCKLYSPSEAVGCWLRF